MTTNFDKVIEWIDQNIEQVTDLLSQLIKVPSVTTYFDEDERFMHEGEAQRTLKAFLDDMGMQTEFSYPDAKQLRKYEGKAGYYPNYTFEDRPNLYGVYPGDGSGKSILLFGHIDVVSRGSGWNVDPFGAIRKDDRIYGRGTVDMKGGIAAMVIAFKAIQQCGIKLKGDVKIGTVVGEEAGGMGTLAFVDKGYRADGCLITEPTHLKVAPLCRGILWGKLIIPGRNGHIELEQGDWREGGAVDAIDKMSLYLEHFRHLNKRWSVLKQHKYLPIPCQINIAQINAGEFPTTFANSAELVFDAQYLPQEKDENGLGGKVKKEIEDFVYAVAQTDDWLRENPPHIEWIVDADCGETLDDQPFFQVVRDTAIEMNLSSSVEGICCHTDMGWLCNVGIPTLNFGPGNARLAHQANECIEIKELVQCTKIIASIIMNWCSVHE
ncbi:MAG: ArgE/DapE family deacylase [Flexilinea sp.]